MKEHRFPFKSLLSGCSYSILSAHLPPRMHGWLDPHSFLFVCAWPAIQRTKVKSSKCVFGLACSMYGDDWCARSLYLLSVDYSRPASRYCTAGGSVDKYRMQEDNSSLRPSRGCQLVLNEATSY